MYFAREKPWQPTFFGYFHQKIRDRFPRVWSRESETLQTSQLLHRPEGAGPTKKETLARFTSVDGKRAVHVAEELLAVNLAYAYKGWAEFKPLVIEMFGHYCEVTQPKSLIIVGLRYINRLSPVDGLTSLDLLQKGTDLLPKALFHWKHPLLVSSAWPGRAKTELQFVLQSLGSTGQHEDQLLLDLKCIDRRDCRLNAAALEKSLDASHDQLLELFEELISDKLRQIMEAE